MRCATSLESCFVGSHRCFLVAKIPLKCVCVLGLTGLQQTWLALPRTMEHRTLGKTTMSTTARLVSLAALSIVMLPSAGFCTEKWNTNNPVGGSLIISGSGTWTAPAGYEIDGTQTTVTGPNQYSQGGWHRHSW
jgi:hypothetical protein